MKKMFVDMNCVFILLKIRLVWNFCALLKLSYGSFILVQWIATRAVLGSNPIIGESIFILIWISFTYKTWIYGIVGIPTDIISDVGGLHTSINAHTTSTPIPPSAYVSMHDLNTDRKRDRTYVSFKPIPEHETSITNQYSRHTLPRHYPRLLPMLAEMQEKQHLRDSDDLDRESSEVDEICNKKFLPPDHRSKP